MPKFCIPFANLDNGLVKVFNCFNAFSLWELLKFNDISRLYDGDLIEKMKKKISIVKFICLKFILIYRKSPDPLLLPTPAFISPEL